MLIKNIAGNEQYFGLGRSTRVRGLNLAAGATAEIPDADTAVRAQVNKYYDKGLIDVLEGPDITRRPASEIRPAFGWLRCASTIAQGDTVDVGGQTFEFAADPGDGVLGEYNSNLSATDHVWAGAGDVGDDVVMAGTLVTAINHLSDTLKVVARAGMEIGTETYIPLERNDDETDGSKTALVSGQATIGVSGAVFYDGISGKMREQARFSHTVTQAEVDEGVVMIATGIGNVGPYQWQTVAAGSNLAVGFDGTLSISGGVFIFVNDGGTLLGLDDVIHLFVDKA